MFFRHAHAVAHHRRALCLRLRRGVEAVVVRRAPGGGLVGVELVGTGGAVKREAAAGREVAPRRTVDAAGVAALRRCLRRADQRIIRMAWWAG